MSYVWVSTQGRRPVGFGTVYIPLRGKWTLNENKSINQTAELIEAQLPANQEYTAILEDLGKQILEAGPKPTKIGKNRHFNYVQISYPTEHDKPLSGYDTHGICPGSTQVRATYPQSLQPLLK
jgi:hypothetical protein